MNAKAYLERFHELCETATSQAACTATLQLMADEVKLIMVQRGIDDPASESHDSILREMNDRWNALGRKDPRFLRDGFLKAYFHGKPAWEAVKHCLPPEPVGMSDEKPRMEKSRRASSKKRTSQRANRDTFDHSRAFGGKLATQLGHVWPTDCTAASA